MSPPSVTSSHSVVNKYQFLNELKLFWHYVFCNSVFLSALWNLSQGPVQKNTKLGTSRNFCWGRARIPGILILKRGGGEIRRGTEFFLTGQGAEVWMSPALCRFSLFRLLFTQQPTTLFPFLLLELHGASARRRHLHVEFNTTITITHPALV